MRYFFDIAYRGTSYHGWQSQTNATGVQQIIEEALLKLTKTHIEITGSGRTDTGVHAVQQVFHADFAESLNLSDFRYHLNAILPKDIVIKDILPVQPDAHARFSALHRSYEYRIVDEKDPFRDKLVYCYKKELKLDILNDASKVLIGKMDFQAFSKVKTSVNNYFCQIDNATWQFDGSTYCFIICADRFLRGMVRAIVGTLLLLNEGKISTNDLIDILNSGDRKRAGRSVSPDGLFLTKVEYPEEIFIK